MKCFDCHAACEPGARFCHQCGRNIQQGRAVPDGRSPAARYPHPESLERWKEMTDRKSSRARRWRYGGGLPALLMLLCGFIPPHGLVVAALGAAVLVIAAIGEHSARTVRKADYVKLPHSRDALGRHRCIFCGNPGIWRQGQYKSNTTYSNCSSCQHELYTE